MQECKQEQEGQRRMPRLAKALKVSIRCYPDTKPRSHHENPIVVKDNDSNDDYLPSLDEFFGPLSQQIDAESR